jgi:hypothetical protein
MAFISLPYGVKVEFSFTKDGQTCINVMWCTKIIPSAIIPADLTAIVNAGQTWWNALRSAINSGTSITSIIAQDWSVPDGASGSILTPASPAGGVIGTALPNNDTIALTMRTGLRGRTRHGRIFLIGLGQAELAGENTLNAPTALDVTNAFQSWKTALNTAGFAPVVASFQYNLAPRAVGQGTAITQVGFTDGTLDSMRRRLPGRGS